MNLKTIATFILLLSLLIPKVSFCKVLDFGFSLGVNYAIISDSSSYRGWGFAGNLSAAFHQENRFGFLANLNYLQVSAQGVVINGITIGSASGPVYIADIAPCVNFDLGTNRHSFGLGYAYGNTYYSANTNNPHTISGALLAGKDYWKNGVYDLAQLFFMSDSVGTYTSEFIFMLTIGYEFR